MCPAKRFRPSAAFTLVELLIVIGVIATLVAVSLGAVQSVSDRGRKIKEVGAARTLIAAYVSTVNDHNGQYMVGYDRSVNEITQPDGSVLSGEPAHRYPFPLAPYFNYQMQDTVLVNYNTHQIDQTLLTYMTSLNPALAMNSFFVGGNTVDALGTISYPADCLQRPALAAGPLIVFASAFYDGGGKRANGYFKLTPPRLTAPMWSPSPWQPASHASDYGNVDARYSGQAVCTFTDGSVRSLTIDELRDMRLWSNRAASNQRNYTITNSSGGGRL